MKKILVCVTILLINVLYTQNIQTEQGYGPEYNDVRTRQLYDEFYTLLGLIDQDIDTIRQDSAYKRSSYGDSVWYRPELVKKERIDQLFLQVNKSVVNAGKADQDRQLLYDIQKHANEELDRLYAMEPRLYKTYFNQIPHVRVQLYIDGLKNLLDLLDQTMGLTR